MAQTKLRACAAPSEFEVLIKEIQAKHLVLVAERKHGKSTSLKTFIKFVKEELGDRVLIKVFDVSQSWFHCAPVEHRQYVTPTSFPVNVGDCVFEMGELSKDARRALVGEVLSLDYRERQRVKRVGGEAEIAGLPMILYVFEEANTYFDSRSLIRKDAYATVLTDFVSVGRNYGLGGVLVVTRMVGELAPGIRERSNLLLGRITGAGELRSLSGLTNKGFMALARAVKKFHWVYWNGGGLGPFRIRDLVKSVPVDFVSPHVEEEVEEPRPRGYWSRFFMGVVAGAVLLWLAAHFLRLYS